MDELEMVWVKWEDSAGMEGWEHLPDDLEDIPLTSLIAESVGWILRADEDVVVLGSSIIRSQPQANSMMAIPQSAILGVRPLRLGRKR